MLVLAKTVHLHSAIYMVVALLPRLRLARVSSLLAYVLFASLVVIML